jgi:hypothetical protein
MAMDSAGTGDISRSRAANPAASILAALAAGAWLLVLLALVLVVPRLEEVFRDFGVVLHAPAVEVLNLSRWVRGSAAPDQVVPGAAVVSPIGLVVLALVVAMGRRQRTALAGAVAAIVLLAGALTFLVGVGVSMGLALAEMSAGLGGGG